MAKIQDLTVNVTLNGSLDYDKIAEEVKAVVQREVERVGVSVNIGESKYRKVTDREPRVGDYVKFSETNDEDITVGKYYEIISFDFIHNPEFIDDAGDENGVGGDEVYEFYEKVGAEPSPATFKNGDYARIISMKDGALSGFSMGEIVRVCDTNWRAKGARHDFAVTNDGVTGYIDAMNLEKVSEDNFAEAKAKQAVAAKWASINRKPNEFKKGDIVRVNGALAEVTRVGIYDLSVQNASGSITPVIFERTGLITPAEARFDR